MSEAPKAKRGDLVVVHTLHHDYIIGQGARSHDEFTVGVVTSVTRDGNVKAYRPVGYDSPVQLAHLGRQLQRTHLVPQGHIDVLGAQVTASKHTWAGGTTPRYYNTLDEVRDALRPHKITAPGSTK